MSRKKIVLGKNLSALLSGQSSTTETKEINENNHLLEIDINKLNRSKYQPRQHMDEKSLDELALSIKNQGIIQPIVVRKLTENSYEILAGERRWTAAKKANLKKVPVIIKDINNQDALAIALIENLQREDLNSIEEARALNKLIKEFSLTHQQAAEAVGKSRAVVSNLIRLLSLPKHIQNLLENGDIEMGHARALLSLNPTQQSDIANLIIEKNLTVREVENKIRDLHKIPSKKTKLIPDHFIKYKNILNEHCKLPIDIKTYGKKGSRVIITCKSIDELKDLVSSFDKNK